MLPTGNSTWESKEMNLFCEENQSRVITILQTFAANLDFVSPL